MEDNRTFTTYVVLLFAVTFGVALWVLDGAPIPALVAVKMQPNKEVSTFQRVTPGMPTSVRVPKGPMLELPRFDRAAKKMSRLQGRPVSADDIAYGVLISLNDEIVKYGNHYIQSPCEKPIRDYVVALVERHFLIKARHPKLANDTYVRPTPNPEGDVFSRTMAEIGPATTNGQVTGMVARLVKRGLLVPEEFRRVAVDELRPYAADVGSGSVEHFKSCQAASSAG